MCGSSPPSFPSRCSPALPSFHFRVPGFPVPGNYVRWLKKSHNCSLKCVIDVQSMARRAEFAPLLIGRLDRKGVPWTTITLLERSVIATVSAVPVEKLNADPSYAVDLTGRQVKYLKYKVLVRADFDYPGDPDMKMVVDVLISIGKRALQISNPFITVEGLQLESFGAIVAMADLSWPEVAPLSLLP